MEADCVGFQSKDGCSYIRCPCAFGDEKASEWKGEAVPGPVPSDLAPIVISPSISSPSLCLKKPLAAF